MTGTCKRQPYSACGPKWHFPRFDGFSVLYQKGLFVQSCSASKAKIHSPENWTAVFTRVHCWVKKVWCRLKVKRKHVFSLFVALSAFFKKNALHVKNKNKIIQIWSFQTRQSWLLKKHWTFSTLKNSTVQNNTQHYLNSQIPRLCNIRKGGSNNFCCCQIKCFHFYLSTAEQYKVSWGNKNSQF